MASEPWYRGVPPVEVEFQVDGELNHRILWRNGCLVLVDHPDLAGEEALVALGGEPCLCLEVLQAWREAEQPQFTQTSWLEMETRPRSPWQGLRSAQELVSGWRVRRSLRGLTSARAALVPPAGAGGFGGGASRPRGDIARRIRGEMHEQLVGSLPFELLERLGLGLVVRELRAGEPVTEMALIHLREHVVDGLSRCVRAWGPTSRPPHVDVQLWLTTKAAPQVVGLVEHQLGYVEAVLPSRWLTAVHARGLAVVDDCFVVDAALERSDHGTVEAVHLARTCTEGWTPAQRTMGVHRTPKGTWHLC